MKCNTLQSNDYKIPTLQELFPVHAEPDLTRVTPLLHACCYTYTGDKHSAQSIISESSVISGIPQA